MYLVYHYGVEAKWCKSKLDVINYLCEVYGWSFNQVYEKLWDILGNIPRLSSITDKNLGLSIELVSTGGI